MKNATWIVCGLFVTAAPGWAHCGKCGIGDKGSAAHAHAHAEIGKPAPNFELKDVDGKEYELSDFKGKVVVLEWINHECPVVNGAHNAKDMAKTFAKYKDQPVVWLAIDSSHFAEEKVARIKKWIKKQSLEYPYLLDAPGKVGHSFGAKTTPHLFVVDQKGVLAYAGAMDNNQYGDKKDVRNYVAEAVDALLKGSTVSTAETRSYGCSVKYKR